MDRNSFRGAESLLMQILETLQFYHVYMTLAGKTRRHLHTKHDAKQMHSLGRARRLRVGESG